MKPIQPCRFCAGNDPYCAPCHGTGMTIYREYMQPEKTSFIVSIALVGLVFAILCLGVKVVFGWA